MNEHGQVVVVGSTFSGKLRLGEPNRECARFVFDLFPLQPVVTEDLVPGEPLFLAMSENSSSHLENFLDRPFGGMKLDKTKAFVEDDIYVIRRP